MGCARSKLVEQRVTMVGLDSAGKTTTLYQLFKGVRIDTEATLGFNVEVIEHNDCRLTIWDLGGQEKIRSCWKKYFLQSHGVIFVVDSADAKRFDESKNELQRMVSNSDLRNVPLLVFANKQDAPGACDAARMAEVLGLARNEITRPKFVQGANAATGEGLWEGLTWLTNEMKRQIACPVHTDLPTFAPFTLPSLPPPPPSNCHSLL